MFKNGDRVIGVYTGCPTFPVKGKIVPYAYSCPGTFAIEMDNGTIKTGFYEYEITMDKCCKNIEVKFRPGHYSIRDSGIELNNKEDFERFFCETEEDLIKLIEQFISTAMDEAYLDDTSSLDVHVDYVESDIKKIHIKEHKRIEVTLQ